MKIKIVDQLKRAAIQLKDLKPAQIFVEGTQFPQEDEDFVLYMVTEPSRGVVTECVDLNTGSRKNLPRDIPVYVLQTELTLLRP